MRGSLPYSDFEPQEAGPQYLEDLATGYWFSEVLFAAVEMDLFSFLEGSGATRRELASNFRMDAGGLERFSRALVAMGLVTHCGGRYFNTKVSDEHLVRNKPGYQGDSILWRRYLHPRWKMLTSSLRAGGRVNYDGLNSLPGRSRRIQEYTLAMDNIARFKAEEILKFFEKVSLRGNILDVGAGAGAMATAFLKRFPSTRATLLELPDVLAYTKMLKRDPAMDGRMRYCPGNILQDWPLGKKTFDMVILSNILHAYSRKELPHILMSASRHLKKRGLLLIHDFFFEHSSQKAVLSDLNMFINTFNGRVFSGKSVVKEMNRLGLSSIGPIALETDTAVIFGAKDKAPLARLHVDTRGLLVSKILDKGFRNVCCLKTSGIKIAEWTSMRCRFGCDRYGTPHCPPNSPTAQQTRKVIKDYTHAVLLEGEPPAREFQRRVLEAEKEAFAAGFYKAFAYWAGPCSLCDSCRTDGTCRNTKDARPSMEGAGIDVFDTVRRSGIGLRTLNGRDNYVKYFGLLLLE